MVKWMTIEQKYALVLKHRRCPTLSTRKLARWAHEAFNLQGVPSASTINSVLHAAEDIEEKQRRGITKRGHGVTCPELESALQRFVETCKQQEVRLSRKLLQQKARQILESLPDAPKMALSVGWLTHFQARHGIRFRGERHEQEVADGSSQDRQQTAVDELVSFPKLPQGTQRRRVDRSAAVALCPHRPVARMSLGMPTADGSKRTVVITGADSDTGLAFVGYYIREGWNVIAAPQTPSKVDKILLLRLLQPSKVVPLDPGSKQSVDALAKELEGVSVDLLINNAGIVENHFMNATTPEDCVRQFQVNALGPFLLTRALLRNFQLAVKEHGCAFVAQITSRMGSISENTSGGAYGFRASKSALHMFTKSLSVDLLPHKVGCLLLHSGFEDSGVTDPEDIVHGMARLIANAKLGDPLQVLHFGSGDVIEW